MSASREKKKRQQVQQTTAPVVETKKGLNKTGKTVLSIVIAVAVVAVIVFFAMVTSGFFEANVTAVTIGEHKLTGAEVNYWLMDTYSQEQQYMSGLVDSETPLKEQDCPEEGYDTWHDYMLDLAMTTASNTYAVYDEAVAAGFTLSEEAQASLQYQIETLDLYGSMYGYSNGNAYLAAMYGPGCKTSSYLEYMTVNTTVQEYATSLFVDNTYTTEELDAHYAENSDDIDMVSYRSFNLTAEETTDEDGNVVVTEEALAAAEEAAIAMAEAAKGSEEKYLELCAEYAPADAEDSFDAAVDTLAPDTAINAAPEACREWLSDDMRASGDTYIAENNFGDGYYVFFYVGKVDMGISLPSVRHILIQPEAEEDGTITDEAWIAAEDRAYALLDEYNAGEQTEDAFAALATANTSDSGSTETGGLYEDIAPGQMVEEFNDWCFAAHEEGDVDVIKTSYGFHVMYFCGNSQNSYRDIVTEQALRQSEYATWEEENEGVYTYTLVNDNYIVTI